MPAVGQESGRDGRSTILVDGGITRFSSKNLNSGSFIGVGYEYGISNSLVLGVRINKHFFDSKFPVVNYEPATYRVSAKYFPDRILKIAPEKSPGVYLRAELGATYDKTYTFDATNSYIIGLGKEIVYGKKKRIVDIDAGFNRITFPNGAGDHFSYKGIQIGIAYHFRL